MYGSTPYITAYNPQMTKDRIDNQIAQLQQMKEQLPQVGMTQTPPAINQTFQLASNGQSGIRYASNIDDVAKQVIYSDTPFFSNDLSVVWIKNTNGDIKTYTLAEVIQKDEKDMIIESLQMQIDELKGNMKNEQSNSNNDNKSVKGKESSRVSDAESSDAK